jgi:AcrR family transcriptional regulator
LRELNAIRGPARRSSSRSVHAHDSVLDAALGLFAERGIDATSMDAIAEASGVSKATIYKHWPDKDALCLEVMARLHGREARPPDVDSGDLRSDLIAALGHQPQTEHADVRMRMMPHLMAHAARNTAFGKAWQARVFDPPRALLTRVLQRAIAKRELPRTLDLDLAIALLLGPMMYEHVLKRLGRDTPRSLREQVVDAFMKSCAPTAARGSAGSRARR